MNTAQKDLAALLASSPVFNVAVNDVDLTNDELKAIIRDIYEAARKAELSDAVAA